MGSQLFRDRLDALLRQRHLSRPRLAAATWYSRGYVWEVITGRKPAVPEFALACDRALRAGGTLVAALQVHDPEGGASGWGPAARPPRDGSGRRPGGGVQRRQILLDLGVLGIAGPLAATEAVRHGLGAALRQEVDADEWEEIADEYMHASNTTPAVRLLPDLTAHLDALGRQIASSSPAVARDLSQAGARLAVVMALALTAGGEARRARRWWRTASTAADRSGDRRTQAWVRGWEVVDGLYEDRPVPQILDRAAESTALVGDVVCAGTAHLYAGLAQTLAVAGRREDCLRALARVGELTDRMPSEVLADGASLLGWPEVRLRHTESYVHTWLGNTAAAGVACERALLLYPDTGLSPRQPSQVMLHRAGCLLRDGDVAGGLAYASEVLDKLPAEHHNDHLYGVGRRVLGLLPEGERDRREAVELRARLRTRLP